MKRLLGRRLHSVASVSGLGLFLYMTLLQHILPDPASQAGGPGSIDNNHGFRKLLEDAAVTTDMRTNASLAQRLPQVMIIGARKCGTRALIEFLNLHPQIFSAQDEMHFFSNDSNYKQGLEWYRRRMPWTQPDEVTIEKTPKYFISPITPARIHRMNSTTKLVVILRNPTTRVISDYTQICANKAARNESMESFESLALTATGHVNIDYRAVQISMYAAHLTRWLELFPAKQLHIVDGDTLISDPLSEIQKVEEFLGLENKVKNESIYFNTTRGFYCMRPANNLPERCLGANKGRKHVSIPERIVHKLNRFFRPQNEKLYKLIDRRFHWR